MTNTPHFNLKKPATTDFVKISDLNDNADAIDTALYNNQNAISSEASTRASADTALGGRIDSEASARQSADNALQAKLTNRNLLDNPWFTVNQRSVSSFGNGYGLDRWCAEDNVINVWGSNIELKSQSGLYQKFEQALKDALDGKTITVSVKASSSIISGTGIYHKNAETTYYSDSSIRVYTSGSGNFNIKCNVSSFSVYAVKLELGSVSTLANDIAPDYGEELRKCQRYFVRYGGTTGEADFGFGSSNGSSITLMGTLPVPMRATPTLSYSGADIYNFEVEGSLTITSLSVSLYTPKTQTTILLRAYTSQEMIAKNPYLLRTQNGYLDFSADL